MACNNILDHPNFNEELKINSDASDFQLGTVVSHKDKLIALNISKLTDVQKIYI